MDFGDAIVALKSGRKVALEDEEWDGQWLSFTPGSKAVPSDNIWSPNNRAHAETLPGRVVEVLPAITKKMKNGAIMMGWTPSQAEMFAENWMVVI